MTDTPITANANAARVAYDAYIAANAAREAASGPLKDEQEWWTA